MRGDTEHQIADLTHRHDWDAVGMFRQSGRAREGLMRQRIGVRPCGWTDRVLGIARLPDVLILELRGAQIAERRMEPVFVVDLLDEVGKVLCDVVEAFEGHRVDSFDLESFHEAFRLGVVIGVTPASHRTDQISRFQRLAVRLGSVLGGFNRLSQHSER
jgi:hypothetical protein